MKKYESATNVAINIVVNGKSRHIAFMPTSNGGSVYYSDDAQEQAAMERHYRYGKLFRGSNVEEEPEEADIEDMADSGGQEEEKAFSDFEDARNWLSETFGLSRTKLRTMEAIEKAAKANGVRVMIND